MYIRKADSSSTPICSQCGSPLVQLTQVTEKLEGVLYPQTTTTFRCSNTECQEEKDLQTTKRLKLRDDKNVAMEKRANEKLERQKMNKELFDESAKS